MARAIETLVTQSILERLSTVEDWPATRAQSLRLLRESMKRDMEWLLNTRRSVIAGIHEYEAVNRSVLQFGLIDTSSLSLSSTIDHKRLQMALQQCIDDFEPRLQNTRVTIETDDLKRRQLRFHIEGQIRLDPAPEEITFDTVLDLSSGEYSVT
jgi:type VI secretion system protein ImpF